MTPEAKKPKNQKTSVNAYRKDISADDLNAAKEKDCYKEIYMPVKRDWRRIEL